MKDDTTLTREQIDALADNIAICAARIDSATHELLRYIREFDEARGWAAQGAKSCAEWLSWRIGIGLNAAREKVRIARRLVDFPRIDEAFERGELSYTKVRAMVRDGMPVDKEEVLLGQALGATGAQMEKISAAYRDVNANVLHDEQRRYVRKRTYADGTIGVEIRVLPDEAERIYQAVRETKLAMKAADDSAESPTMADAAVAMAEAQLASKAISDSCAAERRQLFVHLREARIGTSLEWKAELQDGTVIMGKSLERLACDAGLVVAKMDDDGNPLDVGRRRRTIPPALRRALTMRDRCCIFPGCNQTLFLDAHHLEHWSRGGPTNKENTALVCHRHHMALHEGGFRAERQADGSVIVYDADGRVIDNPPVALDATGMAAVPNDAIDRRTSLPSWDGSHLDLPGAVAALIFQQSSEGR